VVIKGTLWSIVTVACAKIACCACAASMMNRRGVVVGSCGSTSIVSNGTAAAGGYWASSCCGVSAPSSMNNWRGRVGSVVMLSIHVRCYTSSSKVPGCVDDMPRVSAAATTASRSRRIGGGSCSMVVRRPCWSASSSTTGSSSMNHDVLCRCFINKIERRLSWCVSFNFST